MKDLLNRLLALPYGDKLVHALVGLVIGLLFGVIAVAFFGEGYGPASAIVAALVAGVGKEVYDAEHPDVHTTDPLDVVATMLGGIVAAVPLYFWAVA